VWGAGSATVLQAAYNRVSLPNQGATRVLHARYRVLRGDDAGTPESREDAQEAQTDEAGTVGCHRPR
jgi:hypothetical protein